MNGCKQCSFHKFNKDGREKFNLYGALEQFVKGQDSAEILECLEGYVRRAQLVFTTADIKEEPKKKSLIQIWGGDVLMMLFEHVGKVQEIDTFDDSIKRSRRD